jgi:lon-related putative ATP-dependent protease
MEKELRLTPDRLYKRCSSDNFLFDTTDDLKEEGVNFAGQERAVASVDFGIRMNLDGYNIFALGPEEMDKQSLVENLIRKEAEKRDAPSDWVYVCNFEDEQKPVAIRLRAGDAVRFKDMMNRFAEELPNLLTGVFESEEYQNRRQASEEKLKEKEQQDFSEIQQKAEERGLSILRTPMGYSFAPIKDGEILSMDEIQSMSDEEKEKLEGQVQELQKELQKILRQVPERQRKVRQKRSELNREFAEYAVKGLIEEIRREFNYDNEVLEYLDKVLKDIVEHVQEILSPGGGHPLMQAVAGKQERSVPPAEHPFLWRYTVNVMVNNKDCEGAPVICEEHPIYNNLIGRIEHVSEMGALTTDFTYLKPGALHKANGGFLILDALRLLTQPFAWEGLKRALMSRKLKIEAAGDMYGLFSTQSLEPEPITLDVKVVLIGSRLLYYLLCEYDEDFKHLFKVEVDFEEQIDRTPETEQLIAKLIAGLAGNHNLNPLDKRAVARVVEHASRMVSDNEKMSTRSLDIMDLLREADYWSRHNDRKVTGLADVQKAIEQREYRSGRLRDRYREQILRNTLFIDTKGEKTGQVNGLSVLSLGNMMFGHPSRITARARVGKGEVINIEREVKMSGPIHSKGVLILTGFLGARYAAEKPLSLTASLVFEQSYGGVDGDSASSAELYALLSAIGNIPIKQSVAVTGSINQYGEVQPIGGVNEKIEGFFEICSRRELTGEQGVMIPAANIKNLMLKQEVVHAVEEGKFHIYAVNHVDEGMEVLTGLPMGQRSESGNYPEGTVNSLVEKQLDRFASVQKSFINRNNQTSDEKKEMES